MDKMQSPEQSNAAEISVVYINDKKNCASTIGGKTLFEKDQNLQNAPKKTKLPMKASKRKKIFGSIKKRKKCKEQKVTMSESSSGETAGFVCCSFDNNIHPRRVPKRLQRKVLVPQPKHEHSYETFPSLGLKPLSPARYLSPRKDCIQMQSVGINYNTNLPNSQEYIACSMETRTEVSALTMNSPLTKLCNFAMQEARRREESQRTVVSSNIDGSYPNSDTDCISSVNPGIPVASSKISSSSADDFSLECTPQLENLSSLSSQSTDISGSSSSYSASTPAQHNESKPNGTQFASRAAKRIINGVQGMVAGCFAPIVNSPTTKTMNEKEWNAFCQMAKKKP